MMLRGLVGFRSLLGLMFVVHMSGDAPGHCTRDCMVMRVMTGDRPNDRSPDTSLRIERSGKQADGNCQHEANLQWIHWISPIQPSALLVGRRGIALRLVPLIFGVLTARQLVLDKIA